MGAGNASLGGLTGVGVDCGSGFGSGFKIDLGGTGTADSSDGGSSGELSSSKGSGDGSASGATGFLFVAPELPFDDLSGGGPTSISGGERSISSRMVSPAPGIGRAERGVVVPG